MSTYDGTQKANSGCAQNIPYHIFRTSYVDNLRQDALAMASSEAIAFCDVDNFSGPEIECDASTLTEDEWQKRRAHTIGGSDCAAIFGENRYKGYIHLPNQPMYQRPSKNSGGPKYGFTGETRIIPGTTRTAYRIVSRIDFTAGDGSEVHAGDKGGWAEQDGLLSQNVDDSSWVADEAILYGEAVVKNDAVIKDVAMVYGHATVSDFAVVKDDASVCDHAVVTNYSVVYGNAVIFGRAIINKAWVNADIGGDITVGESEWLDENLIL